MDPKFTEITGSIEFFVRAGIPVIVSDYVRNKGTVYLCYVGNQKSILASPYHDLVWDKTLAKLVTDAKQTNKRYLRHIVNKARIELGLPLTTDYPLN